MTANKTVVVTGANGGIGFHTALHFARAGANVVMACRNMQKAELAQQEIRKEAPAASITALLLDVSELSSVREFVRQFAERVGSLDVLVNNAGMVAQPLARNSAGHELQLATNFLGAFALTGTLLPYFRRDREARVVNVGSLAHRAGRLNIEDLNWQSSTYDGWRAYANSKLAALCHAFELNRRLQLRGSNIIGLAAHPGFAGTDILYKSDSLRPKTAFGRWCMRHLTKVVPTPAMAARSVIRAASGDDVKGGEYFGPRGLLEITGRPGRARVSPAAANLELGGRLWATSEALTGVRYLSEP